MAKTMKAAVLTRFGGPHSFELRDVAVPEVGPRQVRVRVHATAVNPLDYQIRRGDYTNYVPLPAIIGHDISGVIEELGSDVHEFAVGDEVYYTPKIFGEAGSYAEQHVADVELVGRKPRNLTHLEAASLTLVGGTVWEAFVQRAQLQAGETILIHGGAGGSLGADEAIDFTAEDYVEAVARVTDGAGVNVIFDTIGGDTLTQSPLALADAGRVVSLVDIAQPQNLIEAWGKNAAYHFVFTRQNRGKLDALTDLVERGLVKPVIGATLPLARMGEAHELLENGSARGLRGKVVIDVSGEAGA
ncbi:NADPH:quinone reductase-like Zn-dependent oxidoreductase [Novosphingobium chloroacetimidivorans]|uniref:NADPH:quinone reductase-like Zn-dependent oxidoreductase n=1 Tax=Novosphingobium chloroacetimidivorans TaxID=1428314 RepID=A0A7W7KA93_9SPHN|nr:zinc-binding dehydrogenase [Novosphingobium chloroacetimidivorans]MBB4858811.1 NADPH:quinone reductase-like Zn-dependent oxidoreductase [Novosphingobium chloroacetimidivorans]